jgi:hypothetical protein
MASFMYIGTLKYKIYSERDRYIVDKRDIMIAAPKRFRSEILHLPACAVADCGCDRL